MTTVSEPDVVAILKRLPLSLLWMWLHILAFTIANQRSGHSVLEDKRNKPWRPIPSGRLTATEARRLLLLVVPAVAIAAMCLGASDASRWALLLNWMYNDLGGGSEVCAVRHLLNAVGLVVGTIGTTLVACGESHCSITASGYRWLALEGLIVFTTIHLMDFRDQQGDRARGRMTIPILIGDSAARWSLAIFVMAWSFICPAIWSLGISGWLFPSAMGSIILVRILSRRSVQADKVTWEFWGLWMVSICLLPLSSRLDRVGWSMTLL